MKMKTVNKEGKRGSKPSECEGKHLLERNIRSHITNKHKGDELMLVSRLGSAYLIGDRQEQLYSDVPAICESKAVCKCANFP